MRQMGVGMFYIILIIAFVLTEYKIKTHIDSKMQLGETKDILGGRITLRKYYNQGAFLNFMEHKKEMVKTVSCVCLGLLLLLFAIMLPRKGNRLFKLGLSLAVGGAISNTSDRLIHGHVIDYFSINCRKLKNVVFNLADIAIFIGSLLIFVTSLFSAEGKSCTDKSAE
jgi:signal peptidase II